jgi:apolipoprotein N-acyltransferase
MTVPPYVRFGDLPAMMIVAIAFVITLRQRARNVSA